MKTTEFTLEAQKSIEGYIWMSNTSEPRVFNNESLEQPETYKSSANPFVIEAQLIIGNEISLSIKQVDGIFIINKYQLSDFNNATRKHFAANKMGRVKGLDFVLNWREETDNACMAFPVLMPAEFVFVGFTK